MNCTGDIPDCLSYLTSLEGLNLSRNQLVGHIPNGIGNLASLQQLELGENRLTGIRTRLMSVAMGAVKVTSCITWNSSHQLIGHIPESIGQLSNLHWLSLTNNQLSGTLLLS